jgi:hypothetical protein
VPTSGQYNDPEEAYQDSPNQYDDDFEKDDLVNMAAPRQ